MFISTPDISYSLLHDEAMYKYYLLTIALNGFPT